MPEARPTIAYILKGFPRTSETFITNEIHLLEQQGLSLRIFSIRRLSGQQRHGVIDLIRAPVTYLPETTSAIEGYGRQWLVVNWLSFATVHKRLASKHPIRYFRTLLWVALMGFRYRFESGYNNAFIKEFVQAGHIADAVISDGSIRHLHAHFAHTSTTVTMIASSLCGIPFSFTAHAKDIYAREMNPGELLALKLKRARFVVTCTRTNGEFLKARGGERISVIYHGLDLSRFEPPSAAQRRNPPLILGVGRLVEKKGFDYLVDACSILRDRGVEFECRIVGGKDKFADKVAERIAVQRLEKLVSIHDPVTQEELRAVYSEASVFVLPCLVADNGDRDGIPNVLVEAMAMELPVISTSVSGIPELIDSGVNGLLVEPKDALSLADAIEQLIQDHELGTRMGVNARLTVAAHFDSLQNIKALCRLFVSYLGKDIVSQSIVPGDR